MTSKCFPHRVNHIPSQIKQSFTLSLSLIIPPPPNQYMQLSLFLRPHNNGGVGRGGNLPALLRHFLGARPLLVGPTRDSESIPSSVSQTARLDKQRWLRPNKQFLSMYLCHVGRFNVDFKCIYALHYTSGHQFMHCTVLLCLQFNSK